MKLLLIVILTTFFINFVTSEDGDDFDFCDDDDNRFLYWWACFGGRGRGGGGWGGGGRGWGGGRSVWGILGSSRRAGGGDAEGPDNSEGGGSRGGSFGGSVGSRFVGGGGAGSVGRFSGNSLGGNNARWRFRGGAQLGRGGQFLNRNGRFSRGGGQFWRNGFFSNGGGQFWNRGSGSGVFNQRQNIFGGGWNRFQGGGNFGQRFHSGFNRWRSPQRPIYNFHRTIQNRNFIFPSQTHIHYRPSRGHVGGGHFSRWGQNSGGFHANSDRYWQRPWYNTGGFRETRNINTGMSNFFPQRRSSSSMFSGNFGNRHSPKVIMRPPQYYPGIWRRTSGGGAGGGHSRWMKKVPY